MAVFCKKIKDEYTLYSKILNGLKFLDKNFIQLIDGRAGHKKYKLGQQKLTCVLNNSGFIKVRQAKSQIMDYGFQLFVDFFEKPILRFDADGVTHYNNEDESLTLLEREIRTPHFHKFNKDGKEIAYRNEKISKYEYEIQNDIQLGFDIFCEENYIQDKKGGKGFIRTQPEIFPEKVSNDVHKGIHFP